MASLAGGAAVQAPGPMGAAYRSCIGCTGQSLGQVYWFKHHPGDLTASLDSLRELLGRLKALTGKNRCRLAVLVLPTRLEVEPEQDGERTQRTAEILGLSNDDLLYLVYVNWDTDPRSIYYRTASLNSLSFGNTTAFLTHNSQEMNN